MMDGLGTTSTYSEPALQPPAQAAQRRASAFATDDRDLVARFGHEPALAWDQFMQRYGVQMMHWLQRREDCVDAARDCWLQACERLAADDCRRLRDVRLEAHQPTLWPWLQAVMNTGLVNAFWARLGRVRVPAKVTSLGSDEVTLYNLMIRTGGHASHTLELAARIQPGRMTVDWMLAWERLQQTLNGRDRSRLLALHLRRSGEQLSSTGLDQIAESAAGPADAADVAQLDERLEQALRELSPRQRLTVQLRFEQELPHAAIGKVIGVGESGARHLLREAIEQLQRLLKQGVER